MSIMRCVCGYESKEMGRERLESERSRLLERAAKIFELNKDPAEKERNVKEWVARHLKAMKLAQFVPMPAMGLVCCPACGTAKLPRDKMLDD